MNKPIFNEKVGKYWYCNTYIDEEALMTGGFFNDYIDLNNADKSVPNIIITNEIRGQIKELYDSFHPDPTEP